MSRLGLAKAKAAEKSKPPTAQTPTATHDIVPGKFNENDWNIMVERDNAEEFGLEIVDDLMEKLMSSIYDNYIQCQLLPFTITQARNAITEIVEWYFLARDEGENDQELEAGWAQDEEPEPSATDCWAQGSVPKNHIPVSGPLVEIPEEETPIENLPEKELTPAPEEDDREAAELPDIVSDAEEEETLEQKAVDKEQEIPLEDKKSSDSKLKSKFRPYRGKLKTPRVGKMTESLESTENTAYHEITELDEKLTASFTMPISCTSLLRAQNGRPPGNKEVMYDEFGNVVAVIKLDPEKLPTHKVNIKYQLVEQLTETRFDVLKKKSNGKVKKMRSQKNISADTETVAKALRMKPDSSHSGPLPPPLKSRRNSSISLKNSAEEIINPVIEEMEVARGVIVKEGGRVKKGPGLYYGKFDILEESQKGMKQISLRVTRPGITVTDLLDRATPILRQLGETSPLPPIVPHPPPQRMQPSV